MPEGFFYPNEVEIQWSILIVLYPFITGLVAGAFIVSSLYHVFGVKSLRPVARLSLLTALAFVLVAPLPLLLHLGRPERAFEIFLTPNFRSAMAGFGYIWLSYTILLLAEIWLVFRRDIVLYAQINGGLKGALYRLLTLGSYDISEGALHTDEKIIRVLSLIGIPLASILHGYVGFIFGAVKANPWWSTPLMPIIFLLSAIVSGIALLILMYVAVSRLRGQAPDPECLGALGDWLLGFLVIDVALEGLELLSMAYEAEESWEIIARLITEKLTISYFGIQLLLGSFLPFLVLVGIKGMKLGTEARRGLTALAAGLVLVGVFAMRWNVVIGGQLFSKSLAGFLSYLPPLGGREGVLVALAVMALPLLIFSAIVTFIPPWERPEEEALLQRERMPV